MRLQETQLICMYERVGRGGQASGAIWFQLVFTEHFNSEAIHTNRCLETSSKALNTYITDYYPHTHINYSIVKNAFIVDDCFSNDLNTIHYIYY
jgi:hypothetical protein